MQLFIAALCIVLYAFSALVFLLGYRTMRRYSVGHVVLYGAICSVPALVGGLLHSVFL